MAGVLRLFQMWQNKNEMEKNRFDVKANIQEKPGTIKLWWRWFKSTSYRCFIRCDPQTKPPGGYLEPISYDGTEPNEHFKLIVCYFGCVFMASVMCLFFIFKHAWSPRIVGIVWGAMAAIYAYFMFFRLPRCWFLLMIPDLLTGRARAILILLCIGWTLVGPALNAQTNLRNTADMLACLQEQVNKEAGNLKSAAKSAIKSRFQFFIDAKDRIDRMLNEAKENLKTLYSIVVRMGNMVKKVAEWLDEIVNMCNTHALVPHDQCREKLMYRKEQCQLNTAKAFQFFCAFWDGLYYIGCYWLLLFALPCKIPEMIKEIIKEQILEVVKKSLEAAVAKVKEAFEYELVMDRNITYKETFESNMSEFRQASNEIMREVKKQFETISLILDYLSFITLAFMIFSAIYYQRKYKNSVRFDNYFLNQHLQQIDRERIKLSKEIALPLTRGESRRFIWASSICFATNEKWQLIIPIFTTTSTLLFVLFWISFDYSLFTSMTEQYVMLMEEGGVDVPNYFKIHVQGHGAFSEGFRGILKTFMPQNFDEDDLSKKWQLCIVEPSIPDFKLYENLYIMMSICYVTIIMQVYLERLRHKIGGIFYPEQERKRAVELHNQILVSRGSLIYFAQKQLANRKQALEKTTERLAVSIPIIGKALRVFGDEMRNCFECHEKVKLSDIDNFRDCSALACGVTFCIECFYRTSICQSCGKDKMPKGLYIDYELPDPAKMPAKKNKKDNDNEETIFRLYNPEAKRIKIVKKGIPTLAVKKVVV